MSFPFLVQLYWQKSRQPKWNSLPPSVTIFIETFTVCVGVPNPFLAGGAPKHVVWSSHWLRLLGCPHFINAAARVEKDNNKKTITSSQRQPVVIHQVHICVWKKFKVWILCTTQLLRYQLYSNQLCDQRSPKCKNWLHAALITWSTFTHVPKSASNM